MTLAPVCAARAFSVDWKPSIKGCTSRIMLQIAATPMAPAPTKRTWRHTASAVVAASPAMPCVQIGTKPAQVMSKPASMARPTDKPTRCPAPTKASEKPRSIPVAPIATRKYLVISAAATLVNVIACRPADMSAPKATTSGPRLRSIASGEASSPVRAHFQHFRRGHAFGERQGRIDHQCPPQRDREEHAENAAERAD